MDPKMSSSSGEEEFIPATHGRDTKFSNEQHERLKRRMKEDRATAKAGATTTTTTKTLTRARNGGVQKHRAKAPSSTKRHDSVSHSTTARTKPATAPLSKSPSPPRSFPRHSPSKAPKEPPSHQQSQSQSQSPPPPSQLHPQDAISQLLSSKSKNPNNPKFNIKKTKIFVRKNLPNQTSNDNDSNVNKRAKQLFARAKPWEKFEPDIGGNHSGVMGQDDLREEITACHQLLAHVRHDENFRMGRDVMSYYVDSLGEYLRDLEGMGKKMKKKKGEEEGEE